MRSETNRRRRSGLELRHWWCRLEHRMWSTTTGWFACRVPRGHCRDCRAASCRKCWAFSCSSEPTTAVKIIKHWQRSEDMAAKKVKCCRCWNNPKELGGQLCLRQEVNVSALMHRSQNETWQLELMLNVTCFEDPITHTRPVAKWRFGSSKLAATSTFTNIGGPRPTQYKDNE